MKNRKIAWTLILLLCATALLSGTLLILHADHGCHQTTACPICTALARSVETFLRAAAMLASIGLYIDVSCKFGFESPENRFVPDWTPVRRKVKLLD